MKRRSGLVIHVLIAAGVVVVSQAAAEAPAGAPRSRAFRPAAGTTYVGARARAGVSFISNEGQQDRDVRFYAPTVFGTVFVTMDGDVVYSIANASQEAQPERLVIKEQFLGANPADIRGTKDGKTRVNHFIGDDRAKWRVGLRTYEGVELGELYDGIVLTLKAHGSNVEKIFRVEPGADPDAIRVHVTGADTLALSEAGELEVRSKLGRVTFTKPVAYQEAEGRRTYVDVAYAQQGDTYGFALAPYDTRKPLIIDPLIASTFVGGIGHDGADRGVSLAVDAAGHVYLVAGTKSTDYPTTPGAYDEEGNASPATADVCISKFDSDLTTLLASTYLGGTQDELADRFMHIAIDGDGNVLVAGRTHSSDFPTTAGSYDATYHGGGDVFLSKLNGDLSQLLASTLLGHTGKDTAGSMAIDDDGSIYVSGYTRSINFPTTAGAYQEEHGGIGPFPNGGDVYVAKFSSDLSTLSASTLIGGSSLEENGIVLPGPHGRVYVSGTTDSADFPTTPGAFDTSYTGPTGFMDIFVSCLSDDLSTLIASTFVGAGAVDVGAGMALDADGNVYVTGLTTSVDFPTSPGAYIEQYVGIGGHPLGDDAYVVKLDADLTARLAATYLGGTGWEHAWRIAIGAEGDVYVAGITTSVDFPTTAGAFSRTHYGGNFIQFGTSGGEGYVSRLDANLSHLTASTFFGSGGSDYLSSMVLDHDGNVYVGGGTNSSSYPATAGAYDESYNGGSENAFGGDLFVAKFDALLSADCNENGIIDSTDIDGGASADLDGDGVPDECQGGCCGCECSDTAAIECFVSGREYSGVGVLCGSAGSCEPEPLDHDECGGALAIPSDRDVTVPLDNRCATLDGPPSVSCPRPQPFENDLWFTYETPCSGEATISLCDATGFDTIMAIYGGGAMCECPDDNSSLIACDDDTCGVAGGPSTVTLPMERRACYTIRAAGWNGASGLGELNIQIECAEVEIPTVSEWGLLAMGLVVLAAGTAALRKGHQRRRTRHV